MFKPLLRVLPSLSGNVKLACNLLDYIEIEDKDDVKTFETNIRYAKLYPITSSSWNNKIDAGLLGSSWEYDIKKFYNTYADIFYKDPTVYSKTEMLKLDKHNDMRVRNKDIEFGVKRISHSRQGNQFAFFAPFYIDDVNDIPQYFMLTVTLDNGTYKLKKNIKINIGNNSESKYNYLSNYLKKYIAKIDNNVIFFLSDTKQATYDGIDVVHGGFAKSIDNAVSILYTNQNTIQNFDAMICNGFKRNKVAMKQIIPLSFYFNVNDILTKREKFRYRNCSCMFSGAYYGANGKKVDFYDFAIDYDVFKRDILVMDNNYGTMSWSSGNVENVMDVGFPSLNERYYVKYQFANKINPTFCRWKLKYSDDDQPYITNMSWAFSKNQGSNYKYGLFPTKFDQLEGVANYIKIDNDYQYNLVFPFSENKEYYDNYDASISKNYKNEMNNYCFNWFEIIDNADNSIFDLDIWKNVDGTGIYYDGILYDLQNLYDSTDVTTKIDKFAMLVTPVTNILTWSEIANLRFADYTLVRQVSNETENVNAIVNDALLYSSLEEKDSANYLYEGEQWNSIKNYQDELRFNQIFTYAYDKGDYVDLNEIGINFYDINKYYDAADINIIVKNQEEKIQKDIINNNIYAYFVNSYIHLLSDFSSYAISSYLQLPIYKSTVISYDDSTPEYVEKREKYNEYMSYVRYAYADNEDEILKCKEMAEESYGLPFTNSYIINAPNFSEYLAENLYYHVRDDAKNIFLPSYTTIEWSPNKSTKTYYSYLRSGNPNYNNIAFGNTFYVKNEFFKTSYLTDLNNGFPSEYLQAYIATKSIMDYRYYGFSYWKYEDILDKDNYVDGDITYGDICNAYAYSAYLYRGTNDYLRNIAGNIQQKLDSTFLNHYIFNPVVQYSGNIYASDVFTELSYHTGKFSGDIIPSENTLEDKNVLWADIYNLNALYRKYKPEEIIDFNDYTSYEFYANFLNKIHIYYYYVELFKNESKEYGSSNINNYFKTEDSDDEKIKFIALEKNSETYQAYLKTEEQNNYEEWFNKIWHTTIFIKRKALIDDQSYCSHPVVRYYYENIYDDPNPEHTPKSFIQWYEKIQYDSEKDVFYYEDDPSETFELVFKKLFFRVDSILWDITNIEQILAEGLAKMYHDIYFYRIQEPNEWDTKYSNSMHVKYINDVTEASGAWGRSVIDHLDSCLIPVFDSIFAQDADDSLVFTHVSLHDITTAYNEHDNTNNYRYNKNHKLMLIKVTDAEKKRYGFTKTYDNYKSTSAYLSVTYDDLGLSKFNINTYIGEDGTVYGFYNINAVFNNTSETFNITGCVDGDYTSSLKYIYYMNGINIYDNKHYLKSIFKQVAPFTGLDLLSPLQNINTIIYPNTLAIDLKYKQNLYNNENNSNEVDITKRSRVIKRISLQRYLDSITPLLTKTIQIPNQYKFKIKNVDRSLLSDGIYNSIGDSPIYPTAESINYFAPYDVYTTSEDTFSVKHYNNKIDEYTPLEYKHYNVSRYINLEEYFEITISKKLKYSEILVRQSSDSTFEVFKNYINSNRLNKYDDDALLFLLNKYKVEYDTTSIGLNISKTEKLYSFKYKFTLL